MMGNVMEWTVDKLKPYPGSPVPGDTAFQQGYMVVRGGSYAMMGASMSLWGRGGFYPKSQFGVGFRCVKDVKETEQGKEEKAKDETTAQ